MLDVLYYFNIVVAYRLIEGNAVAIVTNVLKTDTTHKLQIQNISNHLYLTE